MRTKLESRIITIRGQRVILDSDLAELYGVGTKRLNEQLKRNAARFPQDFAFQLEIQEVVDLRSQNATSSLWGGRRTRPFAFTEHGAVMAANVLNSKVAIDASITLVRVFIRIRAMVAEHIDLKQRLQELERRVASGFAHHEDELREIRFLIEQLEKPIEPTRRKIGFARDTES